LWYRIKFYNSQQPSIPLVTPCCRTLHPAEDVLPISDRKLERLIRALGLDLQQGDLAAFESKVRASASPSLLLAARTQKTLTRGDPETRSGAAKILIRHAKEFLEPEPASEFARYAALSIEVSAARERLKLKVDKLARTLPRLSMRQLLHVAAAAQCAHPGACWRRNSVGPPRKLDWQADQRRCAAAPGKSAKLPRGLGVLR
jgi:hypothetical protein